MGAPASEQTGTSPGDTSDQVGAVLRLLAGLLCHRVELQAHPKGRVLFGSLQLPLAVEPLHPLVDGRPAAECVRSYFATPCAHHPGERGKRSKPQLCARQACESSAKSNGLERRRDSWDGHPAVSKKQEPSLWAARARGLRHFGEGSALGVFVFTLPPELRALCVGPRLKRFRRSCADLAVEVLRRHCGYAAAEFWVRGWFHPEGDASHDYHPHENVLVPLVFFDPSTGRPHRIGLRCLPRSWLGTQGWVAEAYREKLRGIFGEFDCLREGRPLDWYYKDHHQPGAAEKLHKLEYFGRTFPRWVKAAGVGRYMRPRSYGLTHWKRRQHLAKVLIRVRAPLPEHDACAECIAEGVHPDELPPRLPVVGASAEMVEERAARAIAAHSCALCQAEPSKSEDFSYLDYRRIMRVNVDTGPPQGSPGGPGPPSVSPEWVDPTTGEVLSAPPQLAAMGELCAG